MERLHKAAGMPTPSNGGPHLAHVHLLGAFGLFWASSYLLFTARASLLPGAPHELANGRRMLATFIGAWVLVAAASIVGRLSRKSAKLALIAHACAVPLGAALVFTARLMLGWLFQAPDSNLSSELLWVLVWSGYFVAALLAFDIFRSRHWRGPVGQDQRISPQPLARHAHAGELWVHRQGLSRRVPCEQVEFAVAEGNYVAVHYAGTTGLVRGPLSAMLGSLGSDDFIRIHRGVVCRRSLIVAVKRHASGALQAILRDGRVLPVGRHYAGNLRFKSTETHVAA